LNDWRIHLVKLAFIGGTIPSPSSKRVGERVKNSNSLRHIEVKIAK
jgi:hypothetical protein